ncbi:MAG: TIGR03943 family protein [Chthoniobacteraceae bacterium]|jgi:uncharacterized repeat protein (TIGR03943 family)
MTTLFNRWLPGVTLLVWSAVLLVFYFTGRIGSFIVPAFRTNVLVAGAVMLAMACCFIFLPGVAKCCDDERCGHPLGRRKSGRLLTFLILILPVAVAAMFSPKDFGAAAFINRGVATDASGLIKRGYTPKMMPSGSQSTADNPSEPPLPTKDGSQPAQAAATPASSDSDAYLPKSKDGNIVVQVIDLLYAAQDTSMKADFEGKTVETIGQLMPDDMNNPNGNRFKLMRMFMWCCAADAKPIATMVEAPDMPKIPDMAWVKVVGKVDFPIVGGRTIPMLKATEVHVTDPPAETMLY